MMTGTGRAKPAIVFLGFAATLLAACDATRRETPAYPTPNATRNPQSVSAGVTGRVRRIGDGDTLTVTNASGRDVIVRIHGIDAPELGQPFSRASKRGLEDLALGRTVEVFAKKTDRFGRTVGTIMVDGTDIGLEMVRRGYAWHFKRYEKEQSEADRLLYSEAEGTARSQKLGLWADTAPEPPWEYRDAGNERPAR